MEGLFLRGCLTFDRRIVSKLWTRQFWLIKHGSQPLEWQSSLIRATRRIHFPQVQKYFPPGGYCDFLLVNLFRKRWRRVPRLIKREHRTFLYFLHVVACEMLPFFSPRRDGPLHISNPRCNRWKKVQREALHSFTVTRAPVKKNPCQHILLVWCLRC